MKHPLRPLITLQHLLRELPAVSFLPSDETSIETTNHVPTRISNPVNVDPREEAHIEDIRTSSPRTFLVNCLPRDKTSRKTPLHSLENFPCWP